MLQPMSFRCDDDVRIVADQMSLDLNLCGRAAHDGDIQFVTTQRFAQLEKYFAAGAVGLTNNGLIEVRDQGAIALAERATAKRLVAEDNTDRNALYAAIAKANGHPEWEADIRKTFSRRWVERGAQPGWYYQDASGAWKQK